MAWRLRGTYFEDCNCDVVCPCGGSNLALPADNERCVVVKAGDLFELETEDFVPEGMSEPTRLVGVFHPANSTLTVGRATKSTGRVFGIEIAAEGKNAHAAPSEWAA